MPKCCFSFTAFPLPVIVRTICLFENFEKLSTLLGFSKDILEWWVRVCCVHEFLVNVFSKMDGYSKIVYVVKSY